MYENMLYKVPQDHVQKTKTKPTHERNGGVPKGLLYTWLPCLQRLVHMGDSCWQRASNDATVAGSLCNHTLGQSNCLWG